MILRIFRFETRNLPKSIGDPACWERAAGSLFSVSGNKMSKFRGSGFRVQGFRGSRFRVQGSGVQGSGFKVQGSGFRVQGSGFRVQG